jgi:hypothetical protein
MKIMMEWVMHVFVILIHLERSGEWMASGLILTGARQFAFRHHFKVVCKAHPIFYPVINGADLEQSGQNVDMATAAL